MTEQPSTYTLRVTSVCRGCGGPDLEPRFGLGNQYLSDFYADPNRRPGIAPLDLVQCRGCGLVQLTVMVGRDAMYHNRYGYRSGVNAGIRANLETVVKQGMWYQPHAGAWLDIASNDGTLLSYVPKHIVRVGVDPVKAFAPEARAHANLIISDYFHPNLVGGQRFDVVTSISMFYDVPDATRFALGVAKILKPGGVWIVQQNYLPDMLLTGSFDNICHEHLTYFDLAAFEAVMDRVGLQVVHVERDPVNGGCIRTVVCHRGQLPVHSSVQTLRAWEARQDLRVAATWDEFELKAIRAVDAVQTHVAQVQRAGQQTMIYGASTRGSVIWQAADLNETNIAAAVETQEGKIGRFYSALGPVPIISEQDARERHPAMMLVGPYWHKELFRRREMAYMSGGGILAFPLPHFHAMTAGI